MIIYPHEVDKVTRRNTDSERELPPPYAHFISNKKGYAQTTIPIKSMECGYRGSNPGVAWRCNSGSVSHKFTMIRGAVAYFTLSPFYEKKKRTLVP